jgi:hypothetical protein
MLTLNSVNSLLARRGIEANTADPRGSPLSMPRALRRGVTVVLLVVAALAAVGVTFISAPTSPSQAVDGAAAAAVPPTKG